MAILNVCESSFVPLQCTPKKSDSRYSGETVTLITYSNNGKDDDSGREFTLPTKYAREKVAKWFNQTLEVFLTEYTKI